MFGSIVTAIAYMVAMVIGVLGIVIKEIMIEEEYNDEVVQNVSDTSEDKEGNEERNA
jgi:hypothetical protein